MAKIRPEEPTPKKVYINPIRKIRDSLKNRKSPLENEKIRSFTGGIRKMDIKQGRKLVAGISGGFILIIYLLLVHVYSGRFIDGTIINGINAGGKTPEQVEALLEKRIEAYTLSLTMRSTKAAADYIEEVKAIGTEEPEQAPEAAVPQEASSEAEPAPESAAVQEASSEAENADGSMEIIAPVEFASGESAGSVQQMSATAGSAEDGSADSDDQGIIAPVLLAENGEQADQEAEVAAEDVPASDVSGADMSVPDGSPADTTTASEAASQTAGKKQEKSIDEMTPEEKSRQSQDVAHKDVVVEKISGKSFDYNYIPSGEVAEIQKSQNPFLWFIGKFGYKKEYTVASETRYDSNKLSERISALHESDSQAQTSPTNAQIILKNDNSFEIVPETYGTVLNKDGLIKLANEAVKSSTEEVNVAEDEELYEQPVVMATDVNLVNQEEALNQFLNTEITYQLPNDEIRVLGRDTTSQWVSLEDNGYYYLDEAVIADHAAQYAASLAEEFDVVRDTRDFESTNAGIVQVECERYGRLVDEDEEAAKLTEELLSCTSETREPVYSMNNLDKDPTFGGTYVEVDKCDQTVYYYQDHELQMSCECVTGTETVASRSTPTGVYSIYMMERGRTLRGAQQADGSYAYASYVNYWMAFNGGIGLHDATWRDDFGGGIYWYSGSHGCVNLPYWAAKELYSMVDYGTTVIVIDY